MASIIKSIVLPAKERLAKYITKARQIAESATAAPLDASARADARDLHGRTERTIKLIRDETAKWSALIERMNSAADRTAAEKDYTEWTEENGNALGVVDEALEVLDYLHLLFEPGMNQSTPNSRVDEEHTENQPQGDGPPLHDEPSNGTLQQTANATNTVLITETGRRAPALQQKLRHPTFSGRSILEWPTFWDTFRAAVHDTNLPNIDKLCYLRSYLTGDALRTADRYSVRGESYPLVITALKGRFARPAAIREALQAELIKVPTANDSPSSLRATVDAFESICEQLITQGAPADCPFTSMIIKQRIPTSVREKLLEMEQLSDTAWTTKRLRSALEGILRLREDAASRPDDAQAQQPKVLQHERRPQRAVTAQAFAITEKSTPKKSTKSFKRNGRRGESRPQQCLFCDQPDHWPGKCPRYSTSESRAKRLVQLERCFICLKATQPPHKGPECRSGRQCSKCQSKKHHAILCSKASEPNQSEARGSHTIVTDGEMIGHLRTNVPSQTLLMTTDALVEPTGRPGEGQKLLLFFDVGSQVNLITNEAAKRLQLKCLSNNQLSLRVVKSSQPIKFTSPLYAANIVFNDGTRYSIMLQGIPSITTFRTASHNKEPFGEVHMSTQSPQILIGAKYFWDFVKSFKHLRDRLYSIETTIGPTLCGDFNFITQPIDQSVCSISEETPSQIMPEANEIEAFWSLESLGIREDPSENDDETALQQFNTSIKLVNNRYEVGWPWKSLERPFPSNYHLAYSRLTGIVKKLQAGPPELIQRYDAVFRDQLVRGIIEPANRTESAAEHFLPHHAVLTAVKLRLVFDASAKMRGGRSLNDSMRKGPTLIPDLAGLLLRFRLPPVILLSDVEKAFHQISLAPEDREYSKFLWLRDPTQPPVPSNIEVFRFARIPFGVVASPFILSATVRHHLQQEGSDLASEIVANCYVDNVMMSAQTPQEAIEKYTESKRLFSSASMNLREFQSNHPEVNAAIPDSDKLNTAKAKVLGLNWDIKTDCLRVEMTSKTKLSDGDFINRRTVLSEMAATFDPLGITAPCILKAKAFFQTLWGVSHGWDASLSDEETTFWRQLREEWRDQTFTIPRRILPTSATKIELHIFVDASMVSYAAIVFLRCQTENETRCQLLFSKNRLKPRKGVTIPRMELLAAWIGVKAGNFVRDQLRVQIDAVTLWSDSEAVLHWIASSDKPLPVFVTRRIQYIQERGLTWTFRHVSGEENPADISSRGCSPEELRASTLWWKGPPWLVSEETEWPSKLIINPPLPTGEDSFVSMAVAKPTNEEPLVDPRRIGHWHITMKVFSLVTRFIDKCRSKGAEKEPINWAEVELKLIRNLQQCSYISATERKRWRLFEDNDGTLRVASRLTNCGQGNDFVNPIFLPKGSRFPVSLARQIHVRLFHGGVDTTLNEFLQHYWTPHPRREIKRAIASCRHCQRPRLRPFALPHMPPLPPDRVVAQRPYSSIGIDYMGPTTAIVGKKKQKVWILLATCMSTRHVALEVMTDLSTNSLIHALRRLISIYGKPERIRSDRGTSFVAAAKTLNLMQQEQQKQAKLKWESAWEAESVKEFLERQRIDWNFIPAYSPWAGGQYERLNGIVKTAFHRTIGRHKLTLQELITFVAEVAATLNQRPLSYVSSEPGAPTALRPIDLVMPGVNTTYPHFSAACEIDEWVPQPLDTAKGVKKQWETTLALSETFWNKWSSEYLLALRERGQIEHRHGHAQTRRPPEIGEVVIVEKPGAPRSIWQLGRVTNIPNDGRPIRAVDVRLANKRIISRPISKLYPLELGTDKGDNSNDEAPEDPQPTVKDNDPDPEPPPQHHRYNLRPRKPISVSAAITAMISVLFTGIIALTMAIPLPHNTTTQLRWTTECTHKGIGVAFNYLVEKAEVCCSYWPCSIHQQISNFKNEFTNEFLLHDFGCKVLAWTDLRSLPEEAMFTCPAQNECDLIECLLCTERWINMKCFPGQTATWSILILALICAMALCYLASTIRSIIENLIWCWRCLCCCGHTRHRPRRYSRAVMESESEDEIPLVEPGEDVDFSTRPRRSTPSRTVRTWRVAKRFILAGIFITALTSVQTCSETEQITASSTMCTDGIGCIIKKTVDLRILPVGQTTCLTVSRDNNTIASLEVTTMALTLHCADTIEGYHRSYESRVRPSKRCAREGSCYGNHCESVDLDTLVPELDAVNHLPGNSYCVDSCGFWDCGCGYPSTGCLYYRTYAEAIDHALYTTFSCAWEYRAKLSIKYTTPHETLQEEITVHHGMTTPWNNISLFMMVSDAPAPVLNGHFLTDGKRIAMLDDPLHPDLHCTDAESALRMNCSLDPRACSHCRPVGDDSIRCECRGQDLRAILHDSKKLLPIKKALHLFEPEGNSVSATVRHTPMQLSASLQDLTITQRVDYAECSVTSGTLTGCYRCASGADIELICKTSIGSALAQITCGNTTFAMRCDSTPEPQMINLQWNTPRADTLCTVRCPAKTTQFHLEGDLYFVPFDYQAPDGRHASNEKKGDGASLGEISIGAIVDFLFSLSPLAWLGMISTTMIVTVIMLIICRFQPLAMGYRALSVLIITCWLIHQGAESKQFGSNSNLIDGILSLSDPNMQAAQPPYLPPNECGLQMIIGPMFAGKTTALMQKMDVHLAKGHPIALLHPRKDTRAWGGIKTHDGRYCPATPVTRLRDASTTLAAATAIFIDEAHMIPNLLEDLQPYLNSKIIYTAGLNGSSGHAKIPRITPRPFTSISGLITIAKDITVLSAICNCCIRADGTYTVRRENAPRGLVGGAERYQSLCSLCLEQAIASREIRPTTNALRQSTRKRKQTRIPIILYLTALFAAASFAGANDEMNGSKVEKKAWPPLHSLVDEPQLLTHMAVVKRENHAHSRAYLKEPLSTANINSWTSIHFLSFQMEKSLINHLADRFYVSEGTELEDYIRSHRCQVERHIRSLCLWTTHLNPNKLVQATGGLTQNGTESLNLYGGLRGPRLIDHYSARHNINLSPELPAIVERGPRGHVSLWPMNVLKVINQRVPFNQRNSIIWRRPNNTLGSLQSRRPRPRFQSPDRALVRINQRSPIHSRSRFGTPMSTHPHSTSPTRSPQRSVTRSRSHSPRSPPPPYSEDPPPPNDTQRPNLQEIVIDLKNWVGPIKIIFLSIIALMMLGTSSAATHPLTLNTNRWATHDTIFAPFNVQCATNTSKMNHAHRPFTCFWLPIESQTAITAAAASLYKRFPLSPTTKMDHYLFLRQRLREAKNDRRLLRQFASTAMAEAQRIKREDEAVAIPPPKKRTKVCMDTHQGIGTSTVAQSSTRPTAKNVRSGKPSSIKELAQRMFANDSVAPPSKEESSSEDDPASNSDKNSGKTVTAPLQLTQPAVVPQLNVLADYTIPKCPQVNGGGGSEAKETGENNERKPPLPVQMSNLFESWSNHFMQMSASARDISRALARRPRRSVVNTPTVMNRPTNTKK